MTTATLTLTDFLLARYAEREAMAQRVLPYVQGDAVIQVNLWRQETLPDGTKRSLGETVTPYDPRHELADVEAKRRIVTLMGYVRESWENKHSGEGRVMWPDVSRREKLHALTILENLALPHADHPDYREEWKP